MILYSDQKDIDPNFIKKKMKWRYLFFVMLSLIIHLFAWYYVTIFCSVYTKSSVSWVCGGIISVVIKMGFVQPVIPIILGLFRKLYFKYQKQ